MTHDQPPLPFGLDDPHTLTGRHHPATAHQAAARALLRSGSKRRAVLEEIAKQPGTDAELYLRAGICQDTARPRRKELVDLGMVEDSGDRRPTPYGNQAIVWQITDKGRAALAQPVTL